MKFKIISRRFIKMLDKSGKNQNFTLKPKIWINKANNPNFKYFSISLRLFDGYWGIQRVF